MAKNLIDLNFGSVIFDSYKVEHTNESKAFLLLYNTIRNTNLELAKEYGQEILNNTTNLFQKATSLQDEIIILLEQEIELNRDFSDDILKHNPDYIKKSYNIFKNYIANI